MTMHSGPGATAFLIAQYDIPEKEAERIVQIAWEYGSKAQPVPEGYLTVTKVGEDSFEIHPPRAHKEEYTRSRHSSTTSLTRKEPKMAPRGAARTRGRTASTVTVEAAESNGVAERDYTAYATKEATDTMVDFADWLIDEVFGGKYKGNEDDFRDGVRLGGTLRMEYQRSDRNKDRRAARRTAAASNGSADEEEEATAAPKSTRRASAAKAGRTPGRPAARSADRPARGRGKAAAAASTEEAPY